MNIKYGFNFLRCAFTDLLYIILGKFGDKTVRKVYRRLRDSGFRVEPHAYCGIRVFDDEEGQEPRFWFDRSFSDRPSLLGGSTSTGWGRWAGESARSGHLNPLCQCR